MEPKIQESKKLLRHQLKDLRKMAHSQSDQKILFLMGENFKNWLAGAGDFTNIAIYLPIQSEIDPLPIVKTVHNPNFSLCLPVIAAIDKPLLFKEWRPGDELVTGIFNIKSPKNGKTVLPDLVIAPLLGFDHLGNRLGYGGGFYDRTIYELRNKIKILVLGLAYNCQKVSKVLPVEETDQKLDYVLTEESIFSFQE